MTKGSGAECFQCQAEHPKQLVKAGIKFWACSEACVNQFFTDIYKKTQDRTHS
jgi:hypothetical protein